MNSIGWFEIPVQDMDRAVKFYEAVFGQKLQLSEMDNFQMAMFPWEEAGAGASGALVKGEGYIPSHQGTVVYFNCAEGLQQELDRVEPNGGQVLIAKMSIGEYGFVAHFEDTEGNRVALHSME
ncbi:VOC family protein [Rapidithrix thailandica]|uniref:VOC family protein n=1 Tax=Rapidithrix thailandica TaxID=413964 RepID=A0AAW9SAC4_9BACT